MRISINDFWRRFVARIRSTFPYRRHSSPETVRIIAALDGANEVLEAELQQLRGKLEAARSEDSRRLSALEQLGRETERAASRTQNRLAGQESQLNALVSERCIVFKRLDALETAAAKTADQLGASQRQVAGLHGEIEKLAGMLETSNVHISELLEAMNSRLGGLAEKARIFQQLGDETRTELRNQGVRLGWTIMVAAMAIVLATISAAILVWEGQRHAQLLLSVENDLKHLVVSIDQHMNSVHSNKAEKDASTDAVKPGVASAKDETAIEGKVEINQQQAPAAGAADVYGNTESREPFAGAMPETVGGMQKYKLVSPEIQERTTFSHEAATRDLMSPDVGLHYDVVTTGTGRLPTITDQVVVNYIGVTSDGKIIDDTYSSGQLATFHMSKLPPALQEALLNMEEGAEWEVYVPEQQLDSGIFTRRGTQEYGPVLYLIELVEVLRETEFLVTPSIE